LQWMDHFQVISFYFYLIFEQILHSTMYTKALNCTYNLA
jgi:hypothetical protein